MVKPVGPLLESSRQKVEFSRVQIPGGWIHTQCVPVSGRRNALRSTDTSLIEEQLGKETSAIFNGGRASYAVQNFKRWRLRHGRICG